jgi:hypothetical protein
LYKIIAANTFEPEWAIQRITEKNVDRGHLFSCERIMADKYRVIRAEIGGKVYKVRHFNGFMQLLSEPYAEAYFFCQVGYQYRYPDWKLHISVQEQDYERTWNILASLVLKYKLMALKMEAQGEKWPERQYGREFTLYIYPNEVENVYDSYEFPYRMTPELQVEQGRLVDGNFARDSSFWWSMVTEIDDELAKASIKPKGCAKGDFKLGRYVSLRNECFVEIDGENIYPPNYAGWNARGQQIPLIIEESKLEEDFTVFLGNITNNEAALREDLVLYRGVIQVLYLMLFSGRSLEDKKRIVDLLVEIFQDKLSWGKNKEVRSLILRNLQQARDMDISGYIRERMQILKRQYQDKIFSQARRLLEAVDWSIS